jgi:hypothetical protein
MFLIGAQNVNELSKKPAVILGRTGEWLKLRGIDVSKYARRISNFYQS